MIEKRTKSGINHRRVFQNLFTRNGDFAVAARDSQRRLLDVDSRERDHRDGTNNLACADQRLLAHKKNTGGRDDEEMRATEAMGWAVIDLDHPKATGKGEDRMQGGHEVDEALFIVHEPIGAGCGRLFEYFEMQRYFEITEGFRNSFYFEMGPVSEVPIRRPLGSGMTHQKWPIASSAKETDLVCQTCVIWEFAKDLQSQKSLLRPSEAQLCLF
jgi:hypothetical protein